MDAVILVDEDDNAIGAMEKMEAHIKGKLHRAFSVVVFNSKGEMLLQKRARTKYHSGGLWTNTCCSHPCPDEDPEKTVQRRLQYEMGIELTPKFVYKFVYRVQLDHDLIEHELDHVYAGVFDGIPCAHSDEVEDWKYIPVADLAREIETHPEEFSYWFRLMFSHTEFQQRVVGVHR